MTPDEAAAKHLAEENAQDAEDGAQRENAGQTLAEAKEEEAEIDDTAGTPVE